jgi:hypothetical protein
MTSKFFYLIVTNPVTKQFNIHGPMSDDKIWSKLVHEAQEKGKNVNCQAIHDQLSKKLVIQYVTTNLGLEFTKVDLLA